MSDSNPFAAPKPGLERPSRQTVIAWSVAIVMALGAAASLTFWWQTRTKQERELQLLRSELENRSVGLNKALTALQTNQAFMGSLSNRISDLQKEKEEVGQKVKSLEDEMREELESKDVTISKLQGRLTVTIVDRVMFDSGEAVLKADGAAVMQKIADLLAAHPELNIHVIGHTDNVPIRAAAQARFASNWELSAARALAAVHFLTEKAGVDPRRVGAVGYGEFHPVADNSTPEGRAKNRRIAITILPEGLVSADGAPPAPAQAPTGNEPKTE